MLLRAGISIPKSLSLLTVRPGQPRLEKALQVVAAEVKRGASLSDAIGKAPAVFDAPYRALVATGERRAPCPSLERYQDYVDLKQKVGSQVSKAMIYPIVLLVVLSGVLTFLFVEVIPNFVSMYAELGSSLRANPGSDRGGGKFSLYCAYHRRDVISFGFSTGYGRQNRKGPSRVTRRFFAFPCSATSGALQRRRRQPACCRF